MGKMQNVIQDHMEYILKGIAGGDIRKIAALYLATSSRKILRKVNATDTSSDTLIYESPTKEQSKRVLQNWLAYTFPENMEVYKLIVDASVKDNVNDILDMADELRGILDETSRFLLDEYEILKQKRDSDTYNLGKYYENSRNFNPPDFWKELFDNFQIFIKNTIIGGSLFVGTLFAGGAMMFGAMLYYTLRWKLANNNNRLQDRPNQRLEALLELQERRLEDRRLEDRQLEDHLRLEDRGIPCETPKGGQGKSTQRKSSQGKSTRSKTPKRKSVRV